MDKNVSISINGVVFQIEEKAFKMLSEYLNDIKKYFANYDDAQEIVADIEERINENMSAKLSKKKQVITKYDVGELIKAMGTVKDFAEADGDYSQPDKTENEGDFTNKRLYRNPSDRIIAGVCSGVAAYFNLDPVIVRVIFAATLLFGGFGFLLYVILWISMPVADSLAEKMEMEGQKVTLAGIEKTVKENLNKAKKKAKSAVKGSQPLRKKFTGFLDEVLNGLKRAIMFLGPLLSRIVGFFILMISLICGFAVSLGTSVVVFNIDSPLIRIPFIDVVSKASLSGLAIAMGLIILLPIIALLLLGLSLLIKRWLIKLPLFAGLAVVWLVSIIVFATMMIGELPNIREQVEAIENQPLTTEELDLGSFNQIKAGSDVNVEVTQGTTQSIKVIGNQKAIDRLQIEVKDSVLKISKQDREEWCLICFDIYEEIKLEVIAPDLVAAEASGASTLKISGYTEDEFKAEASGASYLEVDLATKELNFRGSGASLSRLSGVAENAKIKTSGASRLKAADLLINSAEVDASGASEAIVNVVNYLNAEANGAARLLYNENLEEISHNRDITGTIDSY